MPVSLKSDLILLGGSIAFQQGAADPSAGGGVAGNIGDLYYRTSTAKLYQKVNAANTAWVYLTPQGLFGDASDGDSTPGVSTNQSQDRYFGNLTINTGIVYDPFGFRLVVRDTLTINAGGIISSDGGNGAAGGTAGAANPTGSTRTIVGMGQAGGAGAVGAGNPGAASANAITGFTGAGGAGGAGSGGGGGAAGALTISATVQNSPRALLGLLGINLGGGNSPRLSGGSGGGAGGGDGTAGPGGGAGGGVMLILARRVINNGIIRAIGGNGGTPAAGNRGGGGGGGGGLIIIGSHAFSGSTPLVTPGTHGGHTGTGVDGSDGTAGQYIFVQL